MVDNVDDVKVFYLKRKHKRGNSEDISVPLVAYITKGHGLILVTSRSKDTAAHLAGSYKNIKGVHAMDGG